MDGQQLYPIRRFVDSDNSCMFNSIAYVTDRSSFNELSALKMRQIIIDVIRQDPDKYNAAYLGKSNDEYIEHILKPSTWGGAIELQIMSEYFKMEIASIDIKSQRVDCYGETNNYQKRVYVIYNGIHYDPLALTFDPSLSDELDITIVYHDDIDAFTKFMKLAEDEKDRNNFVDFTDKATLKCSTCKDVFTNQTEAATHGTNTNHWNFEEI
jgi:ubiquitin thioesterase OTU1